MLKKMSGGRSTKRVALATAVCAAALALGGAQRAEALGITGAVESRYLLTGSPVNVAANAVLKISFETTTAGYNLALCAGTTADFSAGRCTTRLNDSGGPGFKFLTIVDAGSLNGKWLFVLKEVGPLAPAYFSFTIE